MNHLQTYLNKRLEKKGYLFIPYLALGDPDWQTSYAICETMLKNGADAIELGLPFTDPVADGPVLQNAFKRILKKPFNLKDVTRLLQKLHKNYPHQPFIIMGYANIFYKSGFYNLFELFSRYNIQGVIIPDIPWEEKNLIINQHGLQAFTETIAWIDFITPTTSGTRVDNISKHARGFIYLVATKGVTGQSGFTLKPLKKLIQRVKNKSVAPVLVGFGIKNKKHAISACETADGFIVGSRFHEIIEKNLKTSKNILSEIDSYCASLSIEK